VAEWLIERIRGGAFSADAASLMVNTHSPSELGRLIAAVCHFAVSCWRQISGRRADLCLPRCDRRGSWAGAGGGVRLALRVPAILATAWAAGAVPNRSMLLGTTGPRTREISPFGRRGGEDPAIWLRPLDPISVCIASVNEMVSGMGMTPIEAVLVLVRQPHLDDLGWSGV
jgi:hypothetical protein